MLYNKKYLVRHILPIILIAIAACSIHLYFFMSNSYFFPRGTDAGKQFIFFRYLLHELFLNGDFFWSWKYGLGGDIFGSFNYYYSTSPFFWLTLLFKVDEIRDIASMLLPLSILKYFLMMFFMYILLQYHKRSITASLLGALSYAGSTFIAWHSLFFDYMADAFVFLPLVILCYDLFVDKNKKWPFVLSVFLIVFANFYFAFITSIFLNIYAVFKYFLSRDTYGLKDFFRYYLNMAVHYVIGLLLASFSFFPAVYSFFNIDRFFKDFQVPLLFDSTTYKGIIFSMFFPTGTVPLLPFVIALPIIVLFLLAGGLTIKDKNIRIRMLLTIVMIILYLLPSTYSFFNGLSAMQPRWLYLLVFTIAMMIPFIIDWETNKLGKKVYFYSLILLLLILYVKFKYFLVGYYVNKLDLIILGFAVFTFISLILYLRKPKLITSLCLIMVVILNITFMNYKYVSYRLGHYYTQHSQNENYLSSTGFDNEAEKDIAKYLKRNDQSFYRVVWDSDIEFNAPMLYGYNGFSTYQSLLSKNVHRFYKEHYNILQPYDSPSFFKNLDHRTFIESALGNKYYVIPDDSTYSPYNYKLVQQLNGHKVYESNNVLPIGFMYEYGISKDSFKKLNIAQRDQLLLQGVVVEEPKQFGLKTFDPTTLNVDVLSDGIDSATLNHITVDNNTLIAAEGASLTIPIPALKSEGEIILELLLENDQGFHINVNGKQIEKRADRYTYAMPQEKFVFNLGHDSLDEIKVDLSPGTYQFKGIRVYYNSLEKLNQHINKRKESSLYNIQYTEQSMKGRIDVDKKGLLFLSIPYSKGWKAKVDGKPAELHEVNHAFIGIPLEKGKHTIELTYTTPYFKAGVAVSLVSLFLFFIINRRKLFTTNDK